MMRGKFITFEGGEGTGKSTQAAMLALRLESLRLGVKLTREPGGSPGAEIIRHVLLSGAAKPFGPEAEAMLFAAARDDHIQCTILPALAAGKWVVCDRFADSTRVYQGVLGDVDPRFIKALERSMEAGRFGLIAEIKTTLLAALERDRQDSLIEYIGADAASVTAEPWPG